MSELKAGDLCLIVGCVKNPVNVGKVCQLAELLRTGDRFRSPHGRRYQYAGGGEAWLVLGDGLWIGPDNYDGYSLVDPRHLMPLRGDGVERGENAQRELAA